MSSQFSDNFNRTNSGTLGANWTDFAAGWGVNTNQAVTSTNPSVAYWNGGSPAAACYVQAKLVTNTGSPDNLGFIWRWNTTTNDFYALLWNTTEAALLRYDALTPSSPLGGSTFSPPSVNAVVRVEHDLAGNIRVYYDGVLQTTRSDSTYTASGRSAIIGSSGTTVRLDDFDTGTIDVTAALTGQSLTSARGTVTPATSKALTGQGLTGAQGSVSPSVSIALTGQSLTASLGTLAPSNSVPLTGSQGTFETGTLTAVTDNPDVSVALTGQALTLAEGSLSPATDTALSGEEVASAAGTLSPEASVGLSGQSLTGETGTVSVTGGDVTVALTGMALTIEQGTITAEGGDVASVAGGHYWPTPRKKKRRKDRYAEDIAEREELRAQLRPAKPAQPAPPPEPLAVPILPPSTDAPPPPQVVDLAPLLEDARRQREEVIARQEAITRDRAAAAVERRAALRAARTVATAQALALAEDLLNELLEELDADL